MFFLLVAFSPPPQEMATGMKALIRPKAAFFGFWILVFTASRLWNFGTAPWNGDALFDDSAIDLLYLKDYIVGRPFQPAWFHSHPFLISRETLFHYYVWGILRLFGHNILAYEAALFILWCAAFTFTLLLVDLFVRSRIVTSVAALLLTFLVYSFIYTFVGYRYPMTVAFCVASLYFLHQGFAKGRGARLYLSLGGITAGLCFASSMLGKQYLMVLGGSALLFAGFHWRAFRQKVKWSAVSIIGYSFVAAALPILIYIAFNLGNYTYYEGTFIHRFWDALQGRPNPYDMKYYMAQIWSLFFEVPGPRLLLPDALPIPLPYYFFLAPGFILALREKRYEIGLLAIIPVVGVFISAGQYTEHRMLLAVPAWIILIGFTLAGLLTLKLPRPFRISLRVVSAGLLMSGLGPSVQYIYEKTKNPLSIYYFLQEDVAVSRFLRNVVAGRTPSNPPRLEQNEFNREKGIPDAAYDTLICTSRDYSIVALFLHDYDATKVLSLCGGISVRVMTLQDVWSHNKKAIIDYGPGGKDLKLIWERDPITDPITEPIFKLFGPLQDIGRIESLSFLFGGRQKEFYVFRVASKDIPAFQERVRGMPDSPL